MRKAVRFRLAAISPFFLGMTIFCWVIPLSLIGYALASSFWPIGLVGVLMVAIYASVLFWWKPSFFEVQETALVISFPLQQLTVPLVEITHCELTDQRALEARFGKMMRVGAGGLWGGFGWLWSTSKQWLEFYITRQTDYILIERDGGIPLLITPEKPMLFLQKLKRQKLTGLNEPPVMFR